MSIRMTKSTWRGENDVESSPEGSEQVEEIQERHGSHHINKSLSVDHLERAFAEVSLMEKYDCKKVVLDISAHQHLKKTSHDGHSPSETSEVKQEPCIKEPQEKQEEDTAERCEERKASSEKVVESKGEVGEQKKCDEIINKNEEKYLTSIPVGDEDEDEDELSDDESDEEDHGPLITVKLEDIVKDKTEAPYLKQGPNEIGSVHMPYSTNTPKILLEPLKEISGKDKSPLQISKEVRHGPQKETVEERDVKEGDKVGVIDREEKNNKLMSKDEERSFSSADEDVPDDEESSDEEDQVAIITVKLEDVKDDTDEAYLERGPSKGGNVQMRYSPLTPKSHGYSIHGSHGLQPHSSSITAAGLYPSSHMTNLYIDGSVAVTPAPAFVHTSGDPLSPPASDTSSLHDDLEAHTDSLNYANLSGGLIGEHLPEISTPYMTPPHQAVQPTQVYGHIFGQHNSIEEVLEVRHSVITQVDVGEVEPDVGEVEPHYVEQILKDLQTLDGGEFEDLPGLNDTNFDSFSDEHQSPYPAAPRVNHRVGKHSSGYKDIKPKTQPKILSIPQQEMQRHMCKTSLEQICRKMTTMGIDNTRALYHVESDGETCLTRILKRHSDSDNFYENIYALQEILKRIQMCCDTRVDRQQCSKCGQRNPEEFYTPLSVCNMEGKCGLTIAVEKNHPPEVVNYLCSGIEECRKDLQRAFNQQARQIFAHNITSYPVFGRFLSNL
ncbi:uncharacterized protein LOC143039325 isoform X7 [Oratosquilla oratoria]|uniref:uncharacterized protein LOC143039325 isoform X7 n=1 Tax=Oratosquilla oratoria TaxID=337810 RepID=UPI003F7612E7